MPATSGFRVTSSARPTPSDVMRVDIRNSPRSVLLLRISSPACSSRKCPRSTMASSPSRKSSAPRGPRQGRQRVLRRPRRSGGRLRGHEGSRIHGIVRELKNENIDVINYTANEQLLIARALNTARFPRSPSRSGRKSTCSRPGLPGHRQGRPQHQARRQADRVRNRCVPRRRNRNRRRRTQGVCG